MGGSKALPVLYSTATVFMKIQRLLTLVYGFQSKGPKKCKVLTSK